MKYISIILVGLFLWCGCNDEETLVATTTPEFSYKLPQGDHDYDEKIVEWNKQCGFYILYKFEPKDVFFNLDNTWAGLVIDTTYNQKGEIEHVAYHGININQPEEDYVGAQLAWVEEMFLNHYSHELLKIGLPSKLILGRHLQGGSYYGLTDEHYHSNVFNTLMFSYGDASIETLSLSTKKRVKDNVNEWFILEKIYKQLPDLEEFYAKTNYQMILDTKEDSSEWLGLGFIVQYSNAKTIEEAMAGDLLEYLEMAIETSHAKLTAPPIQYDWHSGMLHPEKDVNGKIKEKYDILLRIMKTWGVDLQAIGNLYE